MADVKFTIEFDSNGVPVLKNIEGALDKVADKTKSIAPASKGLDGLGKSGGDAGIKMRILENALERVVQPLGILGPGANLAADAFFQLQNGFTATAGAGIAAGVALGAASNAFAHASDEARDFSAAIQSQDSGFFQKNLERLGAIARDRDGVFSSIGSAIQGIFGDSDRLVFDLTGKIKDYNAELQRIDGSKAREVTETFRLQAEAIGTGPIGKINVEAQLQIQPITQAAREGKIGMQQYRAALAGINDVRAAGVQEFNTGLREQIDLLKTVNDPLAQIEIRMRGIRRGADSGTLGNLEELQRLQENAARIQVGAPLVAQGFSAIGAAAVLPKAQLDQLAISAFDLDKKFQAGLITAKNFSEGLKDLATGSLPKLDVSFLDAAKGTIKEIDDLLRQDIIDPFKLKDIEAQSQALDIVARKVFGADIPAAVAQSIAKVNALTGQVVAAKDAAGKPVTAQSVNQQATGEASVLSQQIEALKKNAPQESGLISDLQTKLQAATQRAGETLVDSIREASRSAQNNVGEVETAVQKLKSSLTDPITVKIDGSGAIGTIDSVIDKIRSMRNEASAPVSVGAATRSAAPADDKGASAVQYNSADATINRTIGSIRSLREDATKTIPLTFDAGITSSPRQPFSQWMDSYAPKKFDALSKKANSMRFSMVGEGLGGGGGAGGGLNGISPGDLLNLTREANSYIRDGGGSSAGPGQLEYLYSRKLAAQQALGLLTRGGASSDSAPVSMPAPAGGDNGGGGAGPVINIYLSGPISGDTLDNTLMPALERTIIRATGDFPQIRVLN